MASRKKPATPILQIGDWVRHKGGGPAMKIQAFNFCQVQGVGVLKNDGTVGWLMADSLILVREATSGKPSKDVSTE